MKCPVCSRELTQIQCNDVVVDVCQDGCAGIWFDKFELGRLDEPKEDASSILSNIRRDIRISFDFRQQRNCPKCNLPLMRHWYSPHDKTEVDECPGCAGMWLDARELVAIRSRFSSHAERQNAAQEYLQRLLGPELEKAQVEGAAYKQRTERLYKFLRFICPSYYFGSE